MYFVYLLLMGIRINIDKGCLWSNFLSYLLASSLVVVPLKTTDLDNATPSKVYVTQHQIKRKYNLWEMTYIWIYDTHENYYFLFFLFFLSIFVLQCKGTTLLWKEKKQVWILVVELGMLYFVLELVAFIICP